MNRRKNKFPLVLFVELTLLAFVLEFPLCRCLQEAVLLDYSPAEIKRLQLSLKSRYDAGYFLKDYQMKAKDGGYPRLPNIPVEKYFRIEPSDAIDGTKYSQPALDYHQLNSYPAKVPSTTSLKDILFTLHSHNPSHKKSKEQNLPPFSAPKDSYDPMRDQRFLEGISNINPLVTETILGIENVTTDNELNLLQADGPSNKNSSFSEFFEKNSFNDSSTNLLPVSSETVLSYENPSSDFNKDISGFMVAAKKNKDSLTEENVPSHTEDPKPTDIDSNISTVLPKITTESSVFLSTHIYVELINQTYATESSVTTTTLPSQYDMGNVSSSSPSTDNKISLSPGVVAGIVIAVLVCVTLLSSAVIYLLYRKYNGKCASVVEGKFNSDNCGYLDDSLRSSIYLNNHIELPKESSEEMSSLDNDSFLNSLETMTIQNYWADNSKNTKV